MSLNSKQKLKCSGCGQLHDIMVWNSVTADDSADLKEEILKGNLNIFKCPDCGFRAVMNVPMLYEDKAKRLFISFVPGTDENMLTNAFENMTESMKESGEIDNYEGFNLRFVSDYNTLMEKILIWDSGLWDKAIEILKFMILSGEPEKEKQRICMFGKADENEIEFMVRDIAENQIYTSRVPVESYNKIKDELTASGVKTYSFNWERVDKNYAAALLGGINNIY